MAVFAHHLKCEVCGMVTKLRIQAGWLKQHPIRYTCGHCGILISGMVYQDQETASFKSEFENAQLVKAPNKIQFHIEASGEFLTEKLTKYRGLDPHTVFSPFFKSGLFQMRDPLDNSSEGNKYQLFQSNNLQFLQNIERDWPIVRRVNELWLNDNHKYLVKEIRKILPQRQFPMNNDLERLRAVHIITRQFFAPVITLDHEELIFGEEKGFPQKREQLYQLVGFFRDSYKRYGKRFLSIFEKFVNIYRFLIPAYGLRFYNRVDEETYTQKGITTASFEDLKEFYIDAYEVAASLLGVVVAFNNLKYRGDYTSMSTTKPEYSLENFCTKTPKGKRIEYIDGQEQFDGLILRDVMDNKIRNGIGHFTYEVDGVKQLITYDPVGKSNPTDFGEIYLVQFAEKCLGLFQTVINLWELVYQSQRFYFSSLGMHVVSPRVFMSPKKEFTVEEARRKANIRKQKRANKNKKR